MDDLTGYKISEATLEYCGFCPVPAVVKLRHKKSIIVSPIQMYTGGYYGLVVVPPQRP